MSQLSFELDANISYLRSTDLPVEVRRQEDLLLIKRVLISDTLDVEPGSYFALGRLPDGQELISFVNVNETSSTAILKQRIRSNARSTLLVQLYRFILSFFRRLKVLGIEVSLETQQKLADFLYPAVRYLYSASQNTSKRLSDIEYLTSPVMNMVGMHWSFLSRPTPQLCLRIFKGNLLQGNVRRLISPNLEVQDDTTGNAQYFLHGTSTCLYAQLLRHGKPPINMALPVWGQTTAHLATTKTVTSQAFPLEVHLGNIQAEVLLLYLNQGYLEEAETTATSKALTVDNLNSEKIADPIAIIVAAYTLLKLGDLNGLGSRIADMMERLSGLPDELIICGEYYARKGQHKMALELFLRLPECGVPIFMYGFNIVMNRLKYYNQFEQSKLEIADLSAVQTLLTNLQQFSAYADFTQPMFTFTGRNPNEPNEEPLRTNIGVADGIYMRNHSN